MYEYDDGLILMNSYILINKDDKRDHWKDNTQHFW